MTWGSGGANRSPMSERAERRTRLEAAGLWEVFRQLREQLKSEGIPLKEASAEAERLAFEGGTIEPAPTNGARQNGTDSELVRPEEFGGRRCSTHEAIQWVFDHIEVEVAPSDAPSPGAWTLLKNVRKHPDLLKDFYRQVWVKTLPPKTHLDAEARMRDDGRQMEMIDRVLEAAEKALGASVHTTNHVS